MKKVLYVAHLQSHLRNFHYWYLKHLKDNGFQVYVATHIDNEEELSFLNGYFDIRFERNPLKLANISAYFKLRNLIKNGNFDIVHCHTPVAGILTRFAARKHCQCVFYTAHGFHFYHGAPLINWMIYFPIEWVASFFTTVLFTMNQEDYQSAKRFFHHPQIEYIHGAGFDPNRYTHTFRNDDEIHMVSVGELNQNKNHISVLQAMVKLNNSQLHYTIAGSGKLNEKLFEFSQSHGLSNNVHLLGYCRDISLLLQTADFFVFPSKREGLPVSVMEAMAAGLPCVVSDIRGNHDLIDPKGGILVSPDSDGIYAGISQMISIKNQWESMGKHNSLKVQNFSKTIVQNELDRFYMKMEHNG